METLSAEFEFRELYDAYHQGVLAYFLRRTDHPTAYDCTEEVFLVAWRRLDQIPKGTDARPWLFGVAHRILLNQQRSARRRLRVQGRLASQPATVPAAPDAELLRTETRAAVTEAFALLSTTDQEVLRLAYWEELPHAEIGRILGCSTGAVDVRLHRAVKRLGKGLKGTGHEASGRTAVLPDEQGEQC